MNPALMFMLVLCAGGTCCGVLNIGIIIGGDIIPGVMAPKESNLPMAWRLAAAAEEQPVFWAIEFPVRQLTRINTGITKSSEQCEFTTNVTKFSETYNRTCTLISLLQMCIILYSSSVDETRLAQTYCLDRNPHASSSKEADARVRSAYSDAKYSGELVNGEVWSDKNAVKVIGIGLNRSAPSEISFPPGRRGLRPVPADLDPALERVCYLAGNSRSFSFLDQELSFLAQYLRILDRISIMFLEKLNAYIEMKGDSEKEGGNDMGVRRRENENGERKEAQEEIRSVSGMEVGKFSGFWCAVSVADRGAGCTPPGQASPWGMLSLRSWHRFDPQVNALRMDEREKMEENAGRRRDGGRL
ncbi:hypothetical protein WN51_02394 [Melipona quadrifasciata]|uniref:Uncharacterized protein n=1 Tax=Melipona quadrifasciata TaxID=166423 RepID=A0A0M8ZUQ4_9HYME|nr:hypothetical protein WN51_02394 [Melipona quadrifasciata]